MTLEKLNIQSVCSYFHIACTLFLFSTLPFYYSIYTQYELILFFASFVIDYIVGKRWQQGFKLNASRVVSLFLLLQFALLFIFGLFESEPKYLSTFYEYRLSFLGFGIVGLLGVNDKFKLRHFAYASVASIIVFFICLYSVLPDYVFKIEQFNSLLREVSHYRALNICSHMTINIFLCVGMALFTKIYLTSKNTFEKIFSALVVILYFAIVMLSNARIGMINASLLFGCILLRTTIKNKKILIPTMALLAVAVISSLYIITTDNPIRSQIPALNKSNPREFIWQEAIEKIKMSPIIGVGASTNAAQFKEMLLSNEDLIRTEIFLLSHLKQDHVYGMHPHNQILQGWQEYGIIGLFAILGLFASIIMATRGSFTLSMVFAVIFVQLLSEVIDGGVTTLGFCTYVYLIWVLLESSDMRKEQISSSNRALSSPCNA